MPLFTSCARMAGCDKTPQRHLINNLMPEQYYMPLFARGDRPLEFTLKSANNIKLLQLNIDGLDMDCPIRLFVNRLAGAG